MNFIFGKLGITAIFASFQMEYAQLAESVDALVSNTNIFGCAGSTPALGTGKKADIRHIRFFA